MSWNHRVIRKKQDDPDEPYFYQIHEVHYNDDGEVWLWTENPTSPCGGDIEELKRDLLHFAEALDEPILDWDELMAQAEARIAEEDRQYEERYGNLTVEEQLATLDREIENLCRYTEYGLHCKLKVGHSGEHDCDDPAIMLRNQLRMEYYPRTRFEDMDWNEDEDTCEPTCHQEEQD